MRVQRRFTRRTSGSRNRELRPPHSTSTSVKRGPERRAGSLERVSRGTRVRDKGCYMNQGEYKGFYCSPDVNSSSNESSRVINPETDGFIRAANCRQVLALCAIC